MPGKKKADDISREEDFRDYDDRNIDEGWPYDDAAGARPVDNAAYGDPKANFDTDRNRGYQVDSVERDGSEERLADSIRPGTKGIEEADDLEERITDAIEELGMIDMASIDVHVEDGTVTLEGAVDDAATSRKIVRRIQRVAGVRQLVNNLRLEGVDSHIPDDD
ncbi:BON domain-containing protein [Neorhizobium tomejilense]|uniref:BON domain-containing protein n=1 Tax=Neorhizobium tomejilense TaxID=2093828 RepID=UPI000CF97517|nr:BON domain-containing protein [Neorhizobium tomejilense]